MQCDSAWLCRLLARADLIYNERSTSSSMNRPRARFHSLPTYISHSNINMRSIISYLDLLALLPASSVYAYPISTPQYGFSISAVPKGQHKTPALQLEKLYRRFGAPVPRDVALASTNTLTAAIPGPYDGRYLCPVTIGGQTFNLNFDTGSADTYVDCLRTNLSNELTILDGSSLLNSARKAWEMAMNSMILPIQRLPHPWRVIHGTFATPIVPLLAVMYSPIL